MQNIDIALFVFYREYGMFLQGISIRLRRIEMPCNIIR